MTAKHFDRRRSCIVAFAAAAFSLTACGQSGSSASDGSSRADAAQATKDLAAIVGTSDQIDVKPITAAIPRGQTVTYMTCQVPVCTEVGRGIKAAATVLGWNYKEVQNNGTPAGYKESWQQIAQTPGNGVVVGYPVLPYPDVTKEMDQAGVPVVSSTSPSPVGGHLIGVVSSSGMMETQGQAMGDWVVSDAGKPVKSLFVYDPAVTSLARALPGYKQAVKKNCPSCKVDVLEVSIAKIGPALAEQVVSRLQSDPDVKYVAFGLGDLATGVPAALKAAGLSDQVRVTVRAASPANLKDVQNGGIAAAFTAELYENGWRAVDMIARNLTRTPLGNQYPIGLTRLITKKNLPTNLTVPYSLPNYQAGFKKAWKS